MPRWRIAPGMKLFNSSLLRAVTLLAVALLSHTVAGAESAPDAQKPTGSHYYPNGMLRQEIEQTRSRRTDRTFYASGVMQRELIWAMNGNTPVMERDVEFSPAGVMLRERRWAAGEPLSDLEFLASGVLASRKDYSGLGSTRELLVQTYFSSGVLSSQQRFALPQRGAPYLIGIQKKFSTGGHPVSEQVFDERGQLVGEKAWSASGQLLPAR